MSLFGGECAAEFPWVLHKKFRKHGRLFFLVGGFFCG